MLNKETVLNKTPEISLQDFGKGKLGYQIGIEGMERILSEAIANIQERNPNAGTVKLYRLLAEQLPSFTGHESQLEAVLAMTNDDPKISRAGASVFVLLNIKSILSAAEPYLKEKPEQEDDLIQAGITHLLTALPAFPLDNFDQIGAYIHRPIITGITQEIAAKENLPVGWIRDNSYIIITRLIEESFIDYPYGLTKEQILDVAKNISGKTGKPTSSIIPIIKHRNPPSEKNKPMDEDDLINLAFNFKQEQTDMVVEAINQLPKRQADAIQLRFGFLDQEYSLEEIGQLLEPKTSPTRTGQIVASAVKKLKKPTIKHSLMNLSFPEQSETINKNLTESTPAVRLINEDLIDPVRFEYRYPLILTGDDRLNLWAIAQANTPYIQTIYYRLQKQGIGNLAELLSIPSSKLLQANFNSYEISQIKLQITKFLVEDAKVVTFGDSLRRRKLILDRG